MKFILFTGTWRRTNQQVEDDVRSAVREVFERGDGIVTGGATGVDYFAMDEAMRLRPDASGLKVVIPAFFDSYIHDYRTNWLMDPITDAHVDALKALLGKIRDACREALVEMPNSTITQHHYNLRHDEEVKISDGVYAFQVNDSTGTQDTIEKASKAGLPILLHKKYYI